MPSYGIPSRRMLKFLQDNPGASSGEINDHLFENRLVQQIQISYRYTSFKDGVYTQWIRPENIVWYIDSKYWTDVQVKSARKVRLSKICRGKFSYLLSPYMSRTLAADPAGSIPHPRVGNPDYQRCWFWRTKEGGRFKYFLTLKGMAAVKEHGLD